MSTLDIRTAPQAPATNIMFFDKGINPIVGKGGSAVAAHMLRRPQKDEHFLQIRDASDFVNIVSAEHARNLIKALNKAIELEWLK